MTRTGAVAASRLILILLFAADLCLILIHGWFGLGPRRLGPAWDLAEDGGHPEFFQYLKLGWIIIALVLAAMTRRAWTLLFLTPLFGYLLLDDALELHERGGGWLSGMLNLPETAIRAQDLGELLIAGGVIGFGLVLTLLGCLLARPAERHIFVDVLLLLGLVAFFAVVMDVLHRLSSGRMYDIMDMMEDGGEMLSTTLIVGYAIYIALSSSSPHIMTRIRQALPGLRSMGRETGQEPREAPIGESAPARGSSGRGRPQGRMPKTPIRIADGGPGLGSQVR